MTRVPTSDLMRILVVDDDEIDRLAIRRHLTKGGFEGVIDEQADATGIEARLQASPYDCVILDAQLPGASGLEVIERLRAAGIGTPILVVSGHDEEVGAAMVAAGATDYLSKPDLSPARLTRRVRYVAELGRAEQRLRRASTQLEAERRLLATVLAQLPVGVLVTNTAVSGVLMANDCASDLAPGIVEDVVAADGPDRAPAARTAQELLRRALATGARAVDSRVEVPPRCLRLSAAPVLDPSGAPAAAVLVLGDLTAEVAAREAALRAVAAREEVLAVVSHDLRGPLGAINVAADAMSDPGLPADRRATYAAAITRSIDRADRLIRDLLDVSVIEAGRLRIERRPVAARELVEHAVRDNELTAGAHDMAITYAVDPAVGRLDVDRDRMLQALSNLIQNAIRHARGRGPIEVTARPRDGGGALIAVRDHGPGIPPEALATVFEPFWQQRARSGGAGLGLAIARGVVEAHGGAIRAVNDAAGGARFDIELPAAT